MWKQFTQSLIFSQWWSATHTVACPVLVKTMQTIIYLSHLGSKGNETQAPSCASHFQLQDCIMYYPRSKTNLKVHFNSPGISINMPVFCYRHQEKCNPKSNLPLGNRSKLIGPRAWFLNNNASHISTCSLRVILRAFVCFFFMFPKWSYRPFQR